MSRGELVPDEIGTTLLRDRLEQHDAVERGWVGDGWTRERANSESLIRYRIHIDLVINLVVPRDVLIARLSGRRQDPVTRQIYHVVYKMPQDPVVRARLEQRKDDTPE